MVGQAILDWMRDQATVPDPGAYYAPGSIGSLLGLPVVLDSGMPPGAWRYWHDGHVAQEGYIGREGEVTAYLDSVGFVSFAIPPVPDIPIWNAPDYPRDRLWRWL